MENKIFFSKSDSSCKHIVGSFHKERFKGVFYVVECIKKEWHVSKYKGDVFQFLDESEVGAFIERGTDRETEKQFRRIQKSYSSIQAKIKYFLFKGGQLY